MRCLLDSHVMLWLEREEKLASSVRQELADPAHQLYVSVASLWELTLKRVAGKLEFSGPFAEMAERYRIDLLPITAAHVAATEELPRFHKDPFDHILLAQARVEGLVLVTRDEVLMRYGVPIWRV